jgi:branched-chain amino acid transport system permease protein
MTTAAAPAPSRRASRWIGLGRTLAVLAAGAVAVYLPHRLAAADLKLYSLMGLAALVTIGLSLLMGFAGQISLGQGAFYALGAYTAGVLAVPSQLFANGQGWNPLLALGAAPLATAAVAALVGVPLLRLRGHYLAFATLALHLILLALIFAWERVTGGQDPGLLGIPSLKIAGHEISGFAHQEIYAAVIWGIVAVALLLAVNLVDSRAGRALQAIAASEPGAAASGINVPAYKLRLFVLSAGLAGLAGGLYAFLNQFLSPDAFPIILSIEFVVMVAVGGMGSLYGAVLGAVAITLLRDRLQQLGTRESLLGFDLPVQAPQVFSLGAFAMILILVMLLFPRGLLPALTGAARRLARLLGA